MCGGGALDSGVGSGLKVKATVGAGGLEWGPVGVASVGVGAAELAGPEAGGWGE